MASPASSYETTSANQKPLLLQLELWSCNCSETISDGWKNLAANHLLAMNLRTIKRSRRGNSVFWLRHFSWLFQASQFEPTWQSSLATSCHWSTGRPPACCCIFMRIEHSKKTASVIIGNDRIIQWLHSARFWAYIYIIFAYINLDPAVFIYCDVHFLAAFA